MVTSESLPHPAILLLAAGHGRWRELRHVIAEWDMLDAGVPTRGQVQQSIAILLGSGLIEVNDKGRVRITRAGKGLLGDGQLRRQRIRARVPVLMRELEGQLQAPAYYVLDEETYRAAVEAYVSRK